MVFVAGQIGWNDREKFETHEFSGQVRQALQNIAKVLTEARAKPEHIVRMTWYVVDKQQYLENVEMVGAAYREIIGKCYPAMSLVQVSALLEDEALVEIEATAVVPAG